MHETRPFFRVSHVSKQQAALEQIDGAIEAFHEGRFAVAITLAGAAEDMAPSKPSGLWDRIYSDPRRPLSDPKEWRQRINGTRNWLKHEAPQLGPTRNLVAFEVALFILRAMDKWEPWSPAMVAFKELFFNSPKLTHPDDYFQA